MGVVNITLSKPPPSTDKPLPFTDKLQSPADKTLATAEVVGICGGVLLLLTTILSIIICMKKQKKVKAQGRMIKNMGALVVQD